LEEIMLKLLTPLAAAALFIMAGGLVWKAEAAPLTNLGSLAATGYAPTEVGYYRRHARRAYRRAYRRGYDGYPYYGYGYYRPYAYRPYYGYGWRPGINIYIGRGWGWRY
jgi:hypothetical protein